MQYSNLNYQVCFRVLSLSVVLFTVSLFQSSTALAEKPTWSFNYDSKTAFRTAEWTDYLNLPFNANQSQSGLFSGLNSAVNSFDYGFYNTNLGGGHIGRSAQHSITYGNFVVGRQCLEQAIADYFNANGITVAPNKYFYDQGFWPMRPAGILSSDSLLTKVSKSLKSLHGGDLVYSKIVSSGPENGAEVVTLNCTFCHEARALIPTCSAPGCAVSGKFKAVRNPWAAEGYISKNTKLIMKAVQDATTLAASNTNNCASGPEKYIFAALHEIRLAKHNSVNPDGTTNYVDLSPDRMIALTPDSSFHNAAGQTAHTVLNLLVNKGSWGSGKPADVNQAYQMFRPEELLFNYKFAPILKANFEELYGSKIQNNAIAVDPAPVNFGMNSAWAQKFYSPTDNMFHGMGCTYKDENGLTHYTNCGIQEKATLLAAATNSQGLNPDLSSNTLSYFPGVPADYKWPLRRYSGTDGVYERTTELFIGLASNGGNPAIQDIVNKRAMTYESIQRGIATYNGRCADCHGGAEIPMAMRPYLSNYVMPISPGMTDSLLFKDASRDTPLRAYIANMRNKEWVQSDAVSNLVMKEYEGHRGDMYYGMPPAPKKLSVKNLVGIAMEQRFGCYLNMTEFLQRATPKPIQVTSSTLDVTNLGFVKSAQYVHTMANQTTALSKPKHLIYWQIEHSECGPLSATGASQPSLFYDAPFHGDRLSGANTNYPKLTATQIKEMIDFFVAISFDGTIVPSADFPESNITLRLNIPAKGLVPGGVMSGSLCDNKCAKLGDTCDPNFEATTTTGKKCCASLSEESGTGRMQMSCTLTAGGSPSWGYCTSDSECFRINPTGYSPYVCVNKQCVPPPPTPSPTPSPTPLSCQASGGSCTTSSQCCSGYCHPQFGACM